MQEKFRSFQRTTKQRNEQTKLTVGHHFFETMCPTAFLAPTLTAKTCFICTQPQNAFFLAQLALQGHRANGKKPLPGRVPGPKKRNQNGSNLGRFKKNSSVQWPKKSPKNWTSSSGKRLPEMPNLHLKVQTQRRPSPMQRR